MVALESTLISHGLPTETSAATARTIEDAVRAEGAVPATVAVLDGVVHVGLDDDALVRVAEEDDVVKASIRDLPVVLSRKATGATTVAATSYVAHRAGIGVFATGGLGGVHRGARTTWDESADLGALGSVPVTVVCAGVKSILDVPATLERLETLSVAVLGYRTDAFPGFYVRHSGSAAPWRVETPEEVAAIAAQRAALGLVQGTVVAQPVAAEVEMDADLHERTLASGLAAADEAGVSGKDVTPFLLAWFHEHTGGREPDGERRPGRRERDPGRPHRRPRPVDRRPRSPTMPEKGRGRVGAPGRERLTARGRSQRLIVGPGAATTRRVDQSTSSVRGCGGNARFRGRRLSCAAPSAAGPAQASRPSSSRPAACSSCSARVSSRAAERSEACGVLAWLVPSWARPAATTRAKAAAR